MSKSVLTFFPHNPHPARTGAHRRFMEMAAGFSALGYRVTLLSSLLTSQVEWTQETIECLRRDFGMDVHIHVPNTFDRSPRRWLNRFYKYTKKEPPIASAIQTPPWMRLWFRRQCQRVQPDIIVMNYALFDGLLSWMPRGNPLRIIDTLDLWTLNVKMGRALQSRLPPYPADKHLEDESILAEEFFAKLGLEADPGEFQVHDRYHFTIAISQQEAEAIRRNTTKTKVVCIPMTAVPVQIDNRYDGPAVFATGPNLFNLHAYLYWVRKVLPHVQRAAPDFRLRVTGAVCDWVAGQDGVVLAGFVPDLVPVYESARFAVCPISGGTGQKVKIVDAMAHGLPVVALRASAEGSPIRHGENGLVADNALEFAEHCLRLWRDRGLCARLGTAARETIASEFSKEKLLTALAGIIN
jgi:glycosyltransferase involved in cell wall biosynthesis